MFDLCQHLMKWLESNATTSIVIALFEYGGLVKYLPEGEKEWIYFPY